MNTLDMLALSSVAVYYIADIAIVIFAYHTIRKIWEAKPLVNWNRYIQKGWPVRSEKVRETLELIYLIGIILAYVVMAEDFVVASVLDLPQVVTNSYYNEKGEIKEITRRYVTVKTEKGRVLHIRIYGDIYKKYCNGEWVNVLYYEHIPSGHIY